MRRPRRHRWVTVSVFFIAYSVFQAVYSPSHASEPIDKPAEEKVDKPEPKPDITVKDESTGDSTPPASLPVTPAEKEKGRETEDESPPEGGKKGMKGLPEDDEADKKAEKDAGYVEVLFQLEQRNGGAACVHLTALCRGLALRSPRPALPLRSPHFRNAFTSLLPKSSDSETEQTRDEERSEWTSNPTVKPLRVNCSPPAIEQFPKPLMGQSARKHGGLIIHVLVAMFTFIGLAIVCDDYFVSSLDRICEELKLAPDVAGATFMAAGSSAPELATVVIGVFCAQDDIGVSGVIGSAVFNIMFVISVCALCAGTVSHLNWWPLCRDCFFYAISILVMLCTIGNSIVSWPEALFMLIMYGVYCIALRYNTTLERWAMTLPLPFKLPTREEQAALVTYRSAGGPPAPAGGDNTYAQMEGQTKETPMQDSPTYNPDGAYDNAAYNAEPARAWDPSQEWDPNRAWDDTMQTPMYNASQTGQQQQQQQQHQQQQRQSQSPGQQQQQDLQQQPPQPAAPAYYKAKEYNPETAVNPLVKPIGANHFRLAWWYLVFPIHWSCRHTMPDCRGRWYPVTFMISMLWISFYSYFMVWMITIIGYTLGIPDTVMGLTFVAAGVSVPDALSSLAVIKEGYGDMAVSNAVGSNVFDILVCLGLPWFIQTAIIHPGSHVNVYHKGLIYSTLSLFSTVIFLVVATHANGWKLDRKYGAVLMVWYILFITLASLYELNVFGHYTDPDCISSY